MPGQKNRSMSARITASVARRVVEGEWPGQRTREQSEIDFYRQIIATRATCNNRAGVFLPLTDNFQQIC